MDNNISDIILLKLLLGVLVADERIEATYTT